MRYTEEQYKAKFEETDSVGWDAIDEALLRFILSRSLAIMDLF